MHQPFALAALAALAETQLVQPGSLESIAQRSARTVISGACQ